ncbi:unnamed protein product [Cunninghamella blakesleeana]
MNIKKLLHDDIPEYECSHVNYKIVSHTKNDLDNHLKDKHEGRHGFQCPYNNCTKNYHRRSSLDQYIGDHKNVEKWYYCTIIAKKKFRSKSVPHRHNQNKHQTTKKTNDCQQFIF